MWHLMKTLQPWIDNPCRLISWYDMQRFSAHLYVKVGAFLTQIGDTVDNLKEHPAAKEEFVAELVDLAKIVREQLSEIGCDLSAQAMQRYEENLPRLSAECINSRASELRSCIADEMRSHAFFWMPPDRAKHYNLFEVRDSGDKADFPSARMEIFEASNCIAFDMGTAAVFHLMRAVEHVIKATWKTLGLPPPKKHESWGELLKPMDDQLQKPPKNPNPLWSANSQFFSELVMDLRAVKRGCRDGTMHVESAYDTKEATSILKPP